MAQTSTASAAPPRASDHLRAAVTGVIGDELDRRSASQEHLDFWVDRESASLLHAEALAQLPLSVNRPVDMQLLLQVMSRSGASLDCWFQASREIDASRGVPYAAAGSGGVPRANELARATAAWLICMKSEDAEAAMVPVSEKYRLDILVAWASRVSTESGGVEVTRAAVLAEEFALFSARRPDLCSPTVPKWLTFLSARFEVVTGGTCGELLHHACGWGSTVAVAWLMRNPYSAQSTPRKQAVGIFCLVLIAVGLLPPRALLPMGVGGDCFAATLDFAVSELRASLQGRAAVSLAPQVALAALEFATDLSLREARQCTMTALDFAFIWAWQRRNPGLPPPQLQASVGVVPVPAPPAEAAVSSDAAAAAVAAGAP